MPTQPSSLAELVVREVTGGRLSAVEQQQVHAWTNEHPAHARMLSCLRDAQWRMQEWQRYKDVDKQAVWTQMQARAAKMPGQAPLPELEHGEWTSAVAVKGAKGRVLKIWTAIVALILIP